MGRVDGHIKPGGLYVVVSEFLEPAHTRILGEVIFILQVRRSAVFKEWYTIRFLFEETISEFVMSDADLQCIKEWTDDHTRSWQVLLHHRE